MIGTTYQDEFSKWRHSGCEEYHETRMWAEQCRDRLVVAGVLAHIVTELDDQYDLFNNGKTRLDLGVEYQEGLLDGLDKAQQLVEEYRT